MMTRSEVFMSNELNQAANLGKKARSVTVFLCLEAFFGVKRRIILIRYEVKVQLRDVQFYAK